VLVHLDTTQEEDPESLQEATLQLRSELLELDIASVGALSVGYAPKGARGGDITSISHLVVTAATSSALLAAVVKTIQSWLERHKGKSVRLEIDKDVLEIKGLSSEDQIQLVQQWIERHAKS
jgi:hypothetical protein